jgi:hypothetical protein
MFPTVVEGESQGRHYCRRCGGIMFESGPSRCTCGDGDMTMLEHFEIGASWLNDGTAEWDLCCKLCPWYSSHSSDTNNLSLPRVIREAREHVCQKKGGG